MGSPSFPKRHVARRLRVGPKAGPKPMPSVTLPSRHGVGLHIKSKVPGPRFWRNIASTLYPAPIPYSSILDNWVLILEACNIPHRVIPDRRCSRLYVPLFLEQKAIAEINYVVQEKKQHTLHVPPDVNSVKGILLFLFLLLVWHGFRMNWYGLDLPGFPPGSAWPLAFGLDISKVLYAGQWWRTATALTIHSDNIHYFANAAFSLVFLIPLCRRAGLGLGMLMTVLSGILGNALNARLHPPGFVSIGFSTALFGCIGAICSIAAMDILRHAFSGNKSPFRFRRLFYPLAAGLALLGLLGGAGELNIDYQAHLCGFGAGLAVGALLAPLDLIFRRLPEGLMLSLQRALFCLSLFLLAAPYYFAFA